VPSGLITNTLSGSTSTSTLSTGGGPGGSTAAQARGYGRQRLVSLDGRRRPARKASIPKLGATVSFDPIHFPLRLFSTVPVRQTTTTSRSTRDSSPAQFPVCLNNSYATSDNVVTQFSPELSSTYKATVTQHLLQGARHLGQQAFHVQAINDRRIWDSSFRQQILYTVNRWKSIYWGLVQAYEDVQAKERALGPEHQALGDNKKQLEIGHHGSAGCGQRGIGPFPPTSRPSISAQTH